MTLTLPELKLKLPSQLFPWADQYGPALLAMTVDEVMEWIHQLAFTGDVYAAYAAVLAKMPPGDLSAEWEKIKTRWASAVVENVARMASQRAALDAMLSILLKIVIIAIGL